MTYLCQLGQKLAITVQKTGCRQGICIQLYYPGDLENQAKVTQTQSNLNVFQMMHLSQRAIGSEEGDSADKAISYSYMTLVTRKIGQGYQNLIHVSCPK